MAWEVNTITWLIQEKMVIAEMAWMGVTSRLTLKTAYRKSILTLSTITSPRLVWGTLLFFKKSVDGDTPRKDSK